MEMHIRLGSTAFPAIPLRQPYFKMQYKTGKKAQYPHRIKPEPCISIKLSKSFRLLKDDSLMKNCTTECRKNISSQNCENCLYNFSIIFH